MGPATKERGNKAKRKLDLSDEVNSSDRNNFGHMAIEIAEYAT